MRPLAWCSRPRSWTASPAGALTAAELIGADRHLERWVVHHRSGWIDWLFIGLSWVGTDGLVFVAAALVVALMSRRPSLFVLVLVSDAAGELISFGLRDWIDRRRPPLVYPEPKPLVSVPHSGSFPSGHATMAFACATVLAWKVPRLAVPAFLLAAAIAWSRVYVGVHWPLDVLGGAILGLAIGTALLAFLGRRWRFGAGADSA